jgi:hypothetical protein
MMEVEKLTEKEYFSFLQEIEESDERLEDDISTLSSKIEEEELKSNSLEEDPENLELEASYGEDAWRILNKSAILYGENTGKKRFSQSQVAMKQRAQQLREERLRIQREAFSQTKIGLYNRIGSNNIRLLVSLLVKSHTEIIEKNEAFINKRLTFLLKSFIPKSLMNCQRNYPSCVKRSPGFLYRATSEEGEIFTFWATPDIPCFLTQNTEQSLLQEHKARFLKAVDGAVKSYHKHLIARSQKELKYASRILCKNVTTYFDLLKLNPFWFELLYDTLNNDK